MARPDYRIKQMWCIEGTDRRFNTKKEAEEHVKKSLLNNIKAHLRLNSSQIKSFQKQIKRLQAFSKEAEWDDAALRRSWKLCYASSGSTQLYSSVSESSVVFSYRIPSFTRRTLAFLRCAVRHHSACLIQEMEQEILRCKKDTKELCRRYAALSQKNGGSR